MVRAAALRESGIETRRAQRNAAKMRLRRRTKRGRFQQFINSVFDSRKIAPLKRSDSPPAHGGVASGLGLPAKLQFVKKTRSVKARRKFPRCGAIFFGGTRSDVATHVRISQKVTIRKRRRPLREQNRNSDQTCRDSSMRVRIS